MPNLIVMNIRSIIPLCNYENQFHSARLEAASPSLDGGGVTCSVTQREYLFHIAMHTVTVAFAGVHRDGAAIYTPIGIGLDMAGHRKIRGI